jgi:uncharacterized protein (TIGR00106 family)
MGRDKIALGQFGQARRHDSGRPGKGGVAMKVIADLCVVPLGVGVSVSSYVAEAERILEKRGLRPRLHAYGTNLEGEWEEVMEAIREVHERLHQMGVPRITSNMRFGTRTDREQSAQEKIRSVEEKM